MALNQLGFYRELEHGTADGDSIVEAVKSPVPLHDEVRILTYLSTATVLAATSQRAVDVLDPSVGEVSSASTRTDGVWAWPEDLAHYVRRYHVSLPSDFVEHVRDLNYSPPAIPSDEMRAIVAEILSRGSNMNDTN